MAAVAKIAFNTNVILDRQLDGDIYFSPLGGPYFSSSHVTAWSIYENFCSLGGHPAEKRVREYGDYSDRIDFGFSGFRYNNPADMPWLLSNDSDLPKILKLARHPKNLYVPALLYQGLMEKDTCFYAPNLTRNYDDVYCRLDHRLYRSTDPDEWAMRPGFATSVVSHGGYPRELFAKMLQDVADRLRLLNIASPNNASSTLRICEYPGFNFGKREITAAERLANKNLHVSKYRADGAITKLDWTKNFRFAFQPEHSRSKCGGYHTEKLPGMLLAGVVPIYYGDPVDYQILNRQRILVLDEEGTHGGDTMSVIAEKVFRLESDAEYRRAFFAVPLLAPTATRRVEYFCNKVAKATIAAARSKPDMMTRLGLTPK